MTIHRPRPLVLLGMLVLLGSVSPLAAQRENERIWPDRDPAWSDAHRKPPMTIDEARVFMKRLAEYVVDHHMRKDPQSAQRGMVYEYFRVSRHGEHDQFIQGEALDTMHDGAWLAAAMAAAYRATGDTFYKDVLTHWQLPFYLKMLNHSDELFVSEPNHARPGDVCGWRGHKEWLLQGREKGFVPYWWDDGGSVSLEMLGRRDGDEHLNFAGHNDFFGQPNPKKLLSGYSHGSSHHKAQDVAVMLLEAWLVLRESSDPEERRLATEVAEAARNLQECRTRHGYANIPVVIAAWAVSNHDEPRRRSLPEVTWGTVPGMRNQYRQAVLDFQPDAQVGVPGFADDQAYTYYYATTREGTLTEPAAFLLAYDAFTLPKLYAMYSDDAPVPPGVNVFDLHPYRFVNGRPIDYRSDRKGPYGGPRPVGSRFGPQNMVVCGWALQGLQRYPHLWERAKTQIDQPNYFPQATEREVLAFLEHELGGGLRTWEAIFESWGYIPTGMNAGNCGAGFPWDELSDSGGYAHLIQAAAQWILYLEGRTDWETRHIPVSHDTITAP